MPTADESSEGRFLIFVRPEFRCQGVSAGLIQTVARVASERGASLILAGRSLLADDEIVGFFERIGMEVHYRRILYSLDAARSLQTLEPYYRRLTESGEIPDRALLVRIEQVRDSDVARFTLEHLGGKPTRFSPGSGRQWAAFAATCLGWLWSARKLS